MNLAPGETTHPRRGWPPRLRLWSLAALLLLSAGCGAMKSQQATEQLLLSRAVDESIARLDFRILTRQKVYLDTQYVKPIKGAGFVNADYIISSLRQQLFAAGCLVEEKPDDADFIVEARVGALGADGHEVIYGVPASNTVSTAATLIPNTPVIPPIPEIALAKRNDNLAAAKVAVFAYHRETKTPVWQSGLEISRSRAKDVWVLGAGPFQSGSIYDKARFAGEELSVPSIIKGRDEDGEQEGIVNYFEGRTFEESYGILHPESEVQPAGFEQDADGQPVPGQAGQAQAGQAQAGQAQSGQAQAGPRVVTDDPAASKSASGEPASGKAATQPPPPKE